MTFFIKFSSLRPGNMLIKRQSRPYIFHLLRVILNFKDEKEQFTSLLHDVMEDQGVTIKELEALSIPKDEIDALVTLTHLTEENYDDYISRILKNELARRIKEADLKDNMNLDRLPKITEDDLERLQKYQRSLLRLKSR